MPDTHPTTEDSPDTRSSAQALKLVGNELRVAILNELAQQDEPLKFTELMNALDVCDSGRLNYHLKKLKGVYVTKTNDKYRLTIQGGRIVSSILASHYVDEDVEYEVTVEGECYECGRNELLLEQIGQQGFVRCHACDCKQFRKSVPVTLWKHRDREAVPEAFDRVVWNDLELSMNNICGVCHSPMSPEVAENNWDIEPDLYGFYDFEVVAVYDCVHCTKWKWAPYGLIAWLHPKVRSFHRNLGVNPNEVKCWQIDQVKDAEFTSVLSSEPFEIEVRFPVEDAECRVVFNERNEITQVTRETYK